MISSRISAAVRDRIRDQAGNRCGYCLSPQHLVLGWLEIEHINPRAADGKDDEENLWLACRFCNNFKAAQTGFIDPESGHWVPLFNPRQQSWNDNFRWSPEGTRVIGVTPNGRATVIALQLNNPIAVVVRSHWVSAGWHPPS